MIIAKAMAMPLDSLSAWYESKPVKERLKMWVFAHECICNCRLSFSSYFNDHNDHKISFD